MAGKVLGNWGADVIKVEPPTGDPSRTGGVALGLPATEGANPHFEQKDSKSGRSHSISRLQREQRLWIN